MKAGVRKDMKIERFHAALAAVALAWLLVLMQTWPPACAAQTGRISGVVTDDKKAPVSGAAVTITSPTGTFTTKTDARGRFELVGVALDTYTVSVERPGYDPYSVQGVTVTADESVTVDAVLTVHVRTIATVTSRGRSVTSAFQPDQTVDRYTLNAPAIDQLLGKSFNTNEKELLSELPGVTVDKQGTALIRGGFSYQTAFEFEGIDYTEPNRSLLNSFENTGNSDLLNGVGSLEIIPGGGDATHGNTGTGLVVLTAKRGTMPPSGTLDLELGGPLSRQIGIDYGIVSKNFSNYIAFTSEDVFDQYGAIGTPASAIGASAITPDPFVSSNVNEHYGALQTSAFYNSAAEFSRDVIENAILKFGRNNAQSLQFFGQRIDITTPLDYGGVNGLYIADPFLSPGEAGSDIPSLFQTIFGFSGKVTSVDGNVFDPGNEARSRNYFAEIPAGEPGTPLFTGDRAYSPFAAFKLEYQNNFNASTTGAIRFYRTFSDQSEALPDQGIYEPEYGGTRTGVATDFTKFLSQHHTLQLGTKYEFAHPFGETDDDYDYVGAYTGGNGGVFSTIGFTSPANLLPDFVTPSATAVVSNNVTLTPGGTPGCLQTVVSPARPPGNPVFNCGYLTHFFPGGVVPPIPLEQEGPTANQQSYALYAQDTYSPNAKLRALLGLRLDGYNFLLPGVDPGSSPAVTGLTHQRLYEPHLGLAYRLGGNDALRANFGRTLAIPLPSFIGTDILRSQFAAFDNVPSYDNATGKPATYCGLPGPTTYTSNGQPIVSGTQLCRSYADQLYWLMRNYRFAQQEALQTPLRGATFTNYDFSYSHAFKDGSAFKITPFYRRGYDVVETVRSLLGYDVGTSNALLSPEFYSNAGLQKATGVEFDVTSRPRPVGLSYQVTATYINQIGNDPAGTYLPAASLALGELYPSPNLSPFQGTIALTYRTRFGLKINPILRYNSGYPYGAGVYSAIDYSGSTANCKLVGPPVYVPLTDAIVCGSNSGLVSNALVNPQDPGSIFNPNIIATRGTESLTSGAGSLRSKGYVTADMTIEMPAGAHSPVRLGVQLQNIFGLTADLPVLNLLRAGTLTSSGNFTSNGGLTSSPSDPSHTQLVGIGSTYGPYIIYPNGTPFGCRFYAQVKL